MEKQITRTVLTVFIASPEDLQKERREAKEVVDELNGTVGENLGWHIDLLGWEDTLPKYGRPQEIINQDVDSCDLFIGLLWKRWGEPTGKYSSGFEEEFHRATNRREETDSPEIWLFFKEIKPDALDDPGEQLQRVLAFRKAQQESKILFYKEFIDSGDWSRQLRKYLTQYLFGLAMPTIPISEVPQPRVTFAPAIPSTASLRTISEGELTETLAPKQLIDIMKNLSNVITQEDVNFETLNEFQIARLHLLTATLVSNRYTFEVLSNHEINLLYKYKEPLETVLLEENLLLRTIINDNYHLCPGWFWYHPNNAREVKSLLFTLAIQDPNENIRKRAVNILNSARVDLPREGTAEDLTPLSLILSDTSDSVRKEALDYLGTIGGLEDIPFIESALTDDDSSVREYAERAKVLITARKNINEAFDLLLSNPKIASQEIVAEIENQSKNINKDHLLDALQHPHEEIRSLAVKVLSLRGELSESIAKSLLEDPSAEIKEACYKELIGLGEEFEVNEIMEAFREPSPSRQPTLLGGMKLPSVDPDEIILLLYNSFTADKLLTILNWYKREGRIAYRALALFHFSIISDRIRSDLDDGFAKLRQESREKLSLMYGDESKSFQDKVADIYDEGVSKSNLPDFFTTQLTSAALAGLALHGESADVEIGRRYLTEAKYDVKVEAVRIIEAFGDASDSQTLVDIAKDSYEELKEIAAKAALKLSPGVGGASVALLETEDPILVGLTVKSIWDEEFLDVAGVLEPLLTSKNDSTRIKVLAYFVKKYSEEELNSLLSVYLEGSKYYYNVVCWLDRVLYAPPPLKEMFVRELEAKLD